MLRAGALAIVVGAWALALPPTQQKLEEAIATGEADAVRKALDAGADANGAGEGAPTSPLTFAALKLSGDDEERGAKIVSLLLSREADPNQAADLRPLYAAILRGNAHDAELLVAAGADPDLAGCMRETLPGTKNGQTARALAALKGEPFVGIVKKAHPVVRKKIDRSKELKRPSMCMDH